MRYWAWKPATARRSPSAGRTARDRTASRSLRIAFARNSESLLDGIVSMFGVALEMCEGTKYGYPRLMCITFVSTILLSF